MNMCVYWLVGNISRTSCSHNKRDFYSVDEFVSPASRCFVCPFLFDLDSA
jgi:hypothetical protein